MQIRTNRSVSVTAIAALVALAGVAGSPAQAQLLSPSSGTVADQRATLAWAESLLDAGRLIAARETVHGLMRNAEALSEADRRQAGSILNRVRVRLESTSPLEISLQKARYALDTGDLIAAEVHARAVAANAGSTSAQASRASAMIDELSARRTELSPLVGDAIAHADREFAAGRYGEAKAALSAALRITAELSAEDRAAADRLQMSISLLEDQRGEPFAAQPAFSLMQPGVLKRRQEPTTEPAPADPEPAPEPAVEPAAQEPAAQEPAALQPDPSQEPAEPVEVVASQPEAQPPDAQPDPAAQPPSDDLIAQALRASAAEELILADRAYITNQWSDARDRYGRLRDVFWSFLGPADRTLVTDRLNAIAARTAGQPGDQLPGWIQGLDVRRQQVIAEFNNDLSEARRHLSEGDVGRARDLVANANLKISNPGNRDLFSASELEARQGEAERLLADIRAEEIRLEDARRTANEADLAEAARRSADEAASQRAQRIDELLDRARAYQNESRYAEALQTIDQLLFIDPINPAGLLLRDVYEHILIYEKFNGLIARKQLAYAKLSLDNQAASLPPVDIVTFPEDWPSLSTFRGERAAFVDTPENRRVIAAVESQRLPAITFSDNSLADAVEFIGTVAPGVNFDVNWEALAEINIQPESTVSLNLKNVTVRTVLDRLVEKLTEDDRDKPAWAVMDGILTISSDEALRKNRVLSIYDIRDLLLDVPDYDEVPEIDLQTALQQSQGGGGQSPFEDNEEDNEDDRRTLEEKAQDVIDIIQNNVDFDGWRDNGGDTGFIQQYQGSLIITNTPANHREIEGLLSKLRQVRAMQINVETRFLLVNQDFFEQIGFDIDVYLNANSNVVRAAQATQPSIEPRDFFNFNRSQPTRRQAQPGRNRVVTSNTATPTDQGVVNPRPWGPIAFEQDTLGLTTGLAPASGIAADVLNASPALGIAGQFLDDIQVDFLVMATQADRRSIQLTAPRLTFTNGQIANIYVATQTSFVSDLQPIVGDSAVGFDPDVDVVTEGVTLLVEGVISADRRFVTINVDAGVARLDGFGREAVTAVAGGELVNSADTQSFIQLPTVTVTRVRTTVNVPDQGTVLLGGQRLVTEFEIETGVPVLSKLPILNRFFTNRIESKEEQTLLILIKPTVLIQSEQEERNFPGLMDSIQRGL